MRVLVLLKRLFKVRQNSGWISLFLLAQSNDQEVCRVALHIEYFFQITSSNVIQKKLANKQGKFKQI